MKHNSRTMVTVPRVSCLNVIEYETLMMMMMKLKMMMMMMNMKTMMKRMLIIIIIIQYLTGFDGKSQCDDYDHILQKEVEEYSLRRRKCHVFLTL